MLVIGHTYHGRKFKGDMRDTVFLINLLQRNFNQFITKKC